MVSVAETDGGSGGSSANKATMTLAVSGQDGDNEAQVTISSLAEGCVENRESQRTPVIGPSSVTETSSAAGPSSVTGTSSFAGPSSAVGPSSAAGDRHRSRHLVSSNS